MSQVSSSSTPTPIENNSAAGNTELSEVEKAAAAAMVNHVHAVASGGIPKEVQLIETQRGEALAETAIKEARGQASAWARIYVSLLVLTAEGRIGFRKITNKHAKEMRANVEILGNTGDIKKTRASALVRLSELNTISKAIDGGAKMDKEWPFHYAVGFARQHLETNGAKDGRGRKTKPVLDKVKEFLVKNVPQDQWAQVKELVETLSIVQK